MKRDHVLLATGFTVIRTVTVYSSSPSSLKFWQFFKYQLIKGTLMQI